VHRPAGISSPPAVITGGNLGKKQCAGDLAVGAASGNQPEHFPFALGETCEDVVSRT
jgi:hypothetical protein